MGFTRYVSVAAVVAACSGAPPAGSGQEVPYGAWDSPITAEMAAEVGRKIGEPAFDDDGSIYWLESLDDGRSALMVQRPGGAREEAIRRVDVRSEAHAYGGGALRVDHGNILFTDAATRELKMLVGDVLLRMSPRDNAWYVDCDFDKGRRGVVCVREDASSGMPTDTIVATGRSRDAPPVQLVAGHDFFAQPRVSPDGTQLAWISWDLPNMPWTGTELWVAQFLPDGGLGPPAKIAGGKTESIYEAKWSPDGELYFSSDRSGYWNIYRARAGTVTPVWDVKAEVGLPAWTLNRPMFAFASKTEIVAASYEDGVGKLSIVDVTSGKARTVATPFTVTRGGIDVHRGHVVMLAASPRYSLSVVDLELATGAFRVLASESNAKLPPELIADAQPITYPTPDGGRGYAFYYPPTNPAYRAPRSEQPPLIVKVHGGPTGRVDPKLNPDHLYWTSRGFAVVDVNYGGSTGHGRAYRERLSGQWGVVDVDDCIAAANVLIERRLVDPHRLLIRGESAGGYTTLAAVAFRDTFRAGASWYGIGDLEKLDAETKVSDKLESGYTQLLVGPYPERRDLFVARSPIHSAERIKAPIIFFQGADDPVVPPSQSREMFAVLKKRRIPTAYIEFPGEKHGFRKLENNARSLRAELYFYRRVLGIPVGTEPAPVTIENL